MMDGDEVGGGRPGETALRLSCLYEVVDRSVGGMQ